MAVDVVMKVMLVTPTRMPIGYVSGTLGVSASNNMATPNPKQDQTMLRTFADDRRADANAPTSDPTAMTLYTRVKVRSVPCNVRLISSGITVWPFELSAAEYFSSPAQLGALGLRVGSEILAGMRLTLTLRTAARAEDEATDPEALKKPETWFASCRTTDLPLYFTGPEADSIALYEQLFAHCKGVYFRFLDDFGDPVVFPAPPECLQQVGFEHEDADPPHVPLDLAQRLFATIAGWKRDGLVDQAELWVLDAQRAGC